MAPWDSRLRDNNTVGGGTFAYIIGGLKLIIFSFGGGEGHLIFIWEEVGHHILYLKCPPSLPILKRIS